MIMICDLSGDREGLPLPVEFLGEGEHRGRRRERGRVHRGQGEEGGVTILDGLDQLLLHFAPALALGIEELGLGLQLGLEPRTTRPLVLEGTSDTAELLAQLRRLASCGDREALRLV